LYSKRSVVERDNVGEMLANSRELEKRSSRHAATARLAPG
jgi:hypothetical protein